MFTFVVTCYNQAEVILYALESIRYQIERFGQGQDFQLIVTDDGSTDDSCRVIRRWMEENQSLFVKADQLFRRENAGICVNYVEALRRVEGERFMVLNGDDLLSPYNLFEVTSRLDTHDIVCTAFLKFTGSGEMITTYQTYLEVVLQRFIRGKTLYNCIRMGCPVMGTALFRRELLTEGVLDFILQFRTVNDRACFQRISHENRDLKVCYVNRQLILYRISGGSVSNWNSPGRLLHNREIAQLCRIERQGEKSPLRRLILGWQEKSVAFRSARSRFGRLLRFCSPYFAVMFALTMVHFKEIRQMERALVDFYWEDCARHYQEMEERCRQVGEKLW